MKLSKEGKKGKELLSSFNVGDIRLINRPKKKKKKGKAEFFRQKGESTGKIATGGKTCPLDEESIVQYGH